MEISLHSAARRIVRSGLALSLSVAFGGIFGLVSFPAQAVAQSSTGALSSAVEQYQADVAWLADDARAGRGMESPELEDSGDWLVKQFEVIGLEPAGDNGYMDPFTAQVMIPDPVKSTLSPRTCSPFFLVDSDTPVWPPMPRPRKVCWLDRPI